MSASKTRPSVPENYLLVSAIAPQSTALLTVLGKRVVDAGCNLLEARVSMLGQEVCALLLSNGSWDAIAKFESALARLAREEQISLTSRRTTSRELGETRDELHRTLTARASVAPPPVPRSSPPAGKPDTD